MEFALRAWTNMRYTALLSSFLLALPLPILVAISNSSSANWSVDVIAWFVLYAVAHILLYPLARELYFCLTEPIRRGVGQMYFWGPLIIIVFAFKIWIYLIISILAIPLGLLGFAYLGLRARGGW